MHTETLSKARLLHHMARNYVIKGLGEKNFDAIPYDEHVVLRAPLRPDGSENALVGKENLSGTMVGAAPLITRESEVYREFWQ